MLLCRGGARKLPAFLHGSSAHLATGKPTLSFGVGMQKCFSSQLGQSSGGGTSGSKTLSTVDTNVTTFAIKSVEGRVINDREKTYLWPVNMEHIIMRYQNLSKYEINRLYQKLDQGTSSSSINGHFCAKQSFLHFIV